MYKHILVPVDGSTTGLTAVDKAVSLAKVFDSWITLVHVIDPYPFIGVGADYALGQTEYLTAATANANQALSSAEGRVATEGLRCDRRVVEGHVMEDGILDTAKAIGADLIVMGSHGRNGLEKLLLGSVTQRVLSHTSLPVLVVRA